MRMLELLVGYLVLGCAAAAMLSRKGPRLSPLDLLFTVAAWPIYVPVTMSSPDEPGSRASEASAPESELSQLVEALEAVDDPVLRRLLPTAAQLAPIGKQIEVLSNKERELDRVLSREELDLSRLVSPTNQDGQILKQSVGRLRELRERARAEREELISLCRRLRMQVTVLRFSGQTADDVSGLVSELLGRVEGLGAAFAPGSTDR